MTQPNDTFFFCDSRVCAITDRCGRRDASRESLVFLEDEAGRQSAGVRLQKEAAGVAFARPSASSAHRVGYLQAN